MKPAAFHPLHTKTSAETGRFAGYASLFGLVDSDRDVVQKGAFLASLRARPEVRLLWQHEAKQPIGVLTKLQEDGRGLFVEAQLVLEVQAGREAYALLKRGAINGLSIGYRVKDYSLDPKTGYRLLHAVELLEISLVTFPANAGAVVGRVKRRAPLLKYDPNQPRDEQGRWTEGGVSNSTTGRWQFQPLGARSSSPDITTTVAHLQNSAKPASLKQCAKYVRQALNAGGFDVRPIVNAKDYGEELQRVGFRPASTWSQQFDAVNLPATGYLPEYSPKAGDVAVIQPYEGGNPSGHMTMHDGQQWISDFRQRGIWPGPGYRSKKPNYVIYRYPN